MVPEIFTEGRLAVDCGGTPLTLKVTVPVNPDAGPTVTAVLPEDPREAEKFEAEIVKLPPPVDAGLTVSVAPALELL